MEKTFGPTSLASRADVAVIIVNYGTAHLAVQAVDSVLERQHHGLGVEVHLVDNASPGMTRRSCRGRAPPGETV